MSKSNHPTNEVYAIVTDDEGQLHEVTAYYEEGENMFKAIEAEATERGLRYADTFQFQFPREV